mmetsp:Transcript_14226/g.16627  ORF Transcript_14226/g.16627 Transcript_14226/m.16627 type:complete len:266 (-) Transcript_14226:47-844(-)
MTLHHTMFQNNCKWYGTLMLGNSCLSPICKWYLLKCQVYFDLCLFSYSAAAVILLGLVIHLLCLIWTWMLSPRTLRWAATWWPVSTFLHLGGAIFWVIITEGIFDSLDEESWYPIPTPGAAFFLACVGGFGECVCVFISFQLMRMWPEVDPDDPAQFLSDSDEPEDDEDEEEEAKPVFQQGFSQPPPPGPTAVPAAADPAAQEPDGAGERRWYYKDKSDEEQGPFLTSMMLGWYAQGSIGADLLLRREDESEFAPLGDGSRFRSP